MDEFVLPWQTGDVLSLQSSMFLLRGSTSPHHFQEVMVVVLFTHR